MDTNDSNIENKSISAGSEVEVVAVVSILDAALRGGVKTPGLRKTRRGKRPTTRRLAVLSVLWSCCGSSSCLCYMFLLKIF